MKKLFLIFTVVLSTQLVNSQVVIQEWCFDQWDNCANYPSSNAYLAVDMVTYPNNIWQFGPPQKNTFSAPYSAPNVLITDTVNPYPINDTSIFIIDYTTEQPSTDVSWTHFYISFSYFVDSDTLTDYGTIEFSADNGNNWIDLINDPVYANYLEWTITEPIFANTTPTLTGSSGGWVSAEVDMHDLGEFLNIPASTTILWRFSFISDAIQNNRDGLMYDNINLVITPPIGIEELDLNTEKKLLKVVDLLGRECDKTSNSTLIYVYDDGSTEKVFSVE